MRCTVVTASRSRQIGSGLTYELPVGSHVVPGMHVRVPLRQKIVEGLVLEVTNAREAMEYDLKEVREVMGDAPLLPEPYVRLLPWIADHYYCSLRQALSSLLPSAPWSGLLPKAARSFRLLRDPDERLGSKQRTVVDGLQGKEWMRVDKLRAETGADAATLRKLLERGILEERTDTASLHGNMERVEIERPVLNVQQQSAYEEIAAHKRTSLLFGITGSGKTEVYATLIADALKQGKQALLLVPEILLTEHIVRRFQMTVPAERIAIVHSRITPAARRETWKAVRRGDIALVIGSRSALFSPFPNLGVVILDEEHEWTYKNEQAPRYHARETAEALCRFANAKLVLGSATPSLESWARAKSGAYHIARLPERYGDAKLPTVRVVDLATAEFGKHYPFSPPLLEAIEDRLRKGEQTVLFLNRRGLATSLMCLDCRRRIVSPHSQLPFTVHRRGGKYVLMDHTTGLIAEIPTVCPGCKSLRLKAVGAGTQKVEDVLTEVFPSARILRADSDTLIHPEQMRLLLEKMRERRADILLGTQTVVKGLDLPEVTLAGVLLADVGLSLPHFRAGERAMQLLTQLTGRSGRAKPGEVIIQTFRPDATEIKAASLHQTELYLEQELTMRVKAGYPPAAALVRILFRGADARERAEIMKKQALASAAKRDLKLNISASPTLFGGGREWHVLLRGDRPRDLFPDLDLSDAAVDIDPVECV